MNLDAHRRTVRRLFEEVITKGDYRAADEIFAADFVWRSSAWLGLTARAPG